MERADENFPENNFGSRGRAGQSDTHKYRSDPIHGYTDLFYASYFVMFYDRSVPTDNIKRSYKLFPPSEAVQDLACATETNSSWSEIRRDRNVPIIVTFPNGR